MNKIGKLLIAGLLVCGFLFSVTGCGEEEIPFVPPEPGEGKVTINDAYDWNEDKTASNRPDLGGDYVPVLPPQEALIRIGEGSSVRFKGGATEYKYEPGAYLKSGDFDETTLGGHKVGGVGILEESEIIGFEQFHEFYPEDSIEGYAAVKDATVMPYYAPENGDYHDFGGYGDTKLWVDGTDTATLTSNYKYSLIDGFRGRTLGYEGDLPANSAIGAAIEYERERNPQEYTFYYRFANFGASEISFTVRQMKNGKTMNAEGTYVDSAPVTLASGATATTQITTQDNDASSNTPCYLMFGAAVTGGISLGVSMEVKNTTDTEPATITLDLPENFKVADSYRRNVKTNDKLVLPTASQVTNDTGNDLLGWVYADGTEAVAGTRITGDITLKPILTNQPFAVSFKLPAGMSVTSDFNTNVKTGDKIVVPTDAQISGTPADGRTIIGWHVVGSGSVINSKSIYSNPKSVLEPVFSRREGTATMCNYGNANDGKPLVFSNVQSNNKPLGVYPFAAGNSTLTQDNFDAISKEYDNDTAVSGGDNGYAELGNILSYNGKMVAGDAFRCGTKISDNDKSNTVVKKNIEHTFYYNFQNFGKKAIHLTVQGVNSGVNVEGEQKTFRLNPGESTTVSYKATFTKGDPNKNIIAYFTVVEETNDLKLGVSVNVVLGRESASVSLKSGIDGFLLKESYLNQKRYVGDTLTLPTDDDYTDAQSATRTVIGWKNGNATIADGAKIAGNIVLEPVFKYLTTVTFEVDADITFTDGFSATNSWYIGDKVVLPTAAQITDKQGREILQWRLKGTGTVVTADTVVAANMIIVPYFKPAESVPVHFTLTPTKGFELNADYLDASRNVGDTLVLPKAGDITNETGKVLEGWKDHKTGEILTDGMILTGDLELEPILVSYLDFSIELPEGMTLSADYKQNYLEGEKLALPTAADITANPTGMGAPAGWYNVDTLTAVTAETVVTDGLTIAPYWKNLDGYTYLDIGSAANYGYNNDKLPGDFGHHVRSANNGIVYAGSRPSATNKGVIISGGDGCSMVGATLKDPNPVTAGTAIRFDSKYTEALTATTIIEFNYTVWNRGTEELRLSIYQISASSEYKAETYYAYEDRYRVDVTLAPGASGNYTAQYSLGKNGNALTYVVFEKDASSFDFGLAISFKKVTSMDAKYKEQAKLANTATFTFDPAENGGITLKDYTFETRAGRLLAAPTAAQYTAPEGVTVAEWRVVTGDTYVTLPDTKSYLNPTLPSAGAKLQAAIVDSVVTFATSNGVSANGGKTAYKSGMKLVLPALTEKTTDGRKHVGWFDTATKKAVTADTVVTGNMQIAPYFAPATGDVLTATGGTTNNIDFPTGFVKANFTEEPDVITGDETGMVLHYAYGKDETAVAPSNIFRFKTPYSIVANHNYKFTYNFTNYGKDEIKFTVYQIRGSDTITDMPSKEITLAPGASANAALELSFTAGNANILTYFVVNQITVAGGLHLGVSMSVADVTPAA